MAGQKSFLAEIKINILRTVYVFGLIGIGINILGAAYILYEIITGTSEQYTEIPTYFYLEIPLFIALVIGFFLIRKFPNLATWIICLAMMSVFIDETSIQLGFSMPILFSSLIISPAVAFFFAFLLSIEASFVYYFVHGYDFSFVSLYEKHLFFTAGCFAFALISFLLSRQLHKAFRLYENQLSITQKQNLELEEARKKLAEKVDIQSKEIETIQEEKEKLGDKLQSMRDSLEKLKTVTRRK